MRAPVETIAFTMPRSINSVTIRPCLATVIAPARVITMNASSSRAIASSTSAASPSWRPVKAVLAIARTSPSMERDFAQIERLQRNQPVLNRIVQVTILTFAAAPPPACPCELP